MRLMGRFWTAAVLALIAEVISLAVSFLQNAVYKAFDVKLITAQ